MSVQIDRRAFLAFALGAAATVRARGQERILLPRVSETTCPLELIQPVATDGHRGLGIVRRPPTRGRKPAIVFIHPGFTTYPRAILEATAREAANPVRFLAAGYVLVVPTYRSRDIDPQTRTAPNDCLAVLDWLRRLDDVDPKSIVVFGCSGGGDLALEVAASDPDIACTVCEEPASVMFTGMLNTDVPKRGERFAPQDGAPIAREPKRFYTEQYQALTRAKIAHITAPILMIQSEPPLDIASAMIAAVNNQILIPELRLAGKTLEVLSYEAQPHCFCWVGGNPGMPGGNPGLPGGPGWLPPVVRGTPTPPLSYPSVALAAYQKIEAFCRPHLAAQPIPLDGSLIEHVPA